MGENMKKIADSLIADSLIIEGPHSLVSFRKKHGDVFSIDVKTNRSEKNPVKKYLFLFDADSVNEVYVKQYKNFEKTGGWLIMRKALGNGLLTTEEPVHLKHRRIINPSFHVNKINLYLNKALSVIKEETDKWIEKEVIDINEEMLSLSYKILTNTIFNDDMLENADDLKEIFFKILEKAGVVERFEDGDFDNYSTRLNTLMDNVIKNRISNESEDKDFIDLLILAAAKDDSLSVQDISDHVITMLLAGHETTASTLVWALANVSQNKKDWEMLNKEANLLIDVNKDNIVSNIKDSNISKFVINESLRLYSPVWYSPRKALVDTKIGETLVEAGTTVVLSSFVTQTSEKYFTNPESFDFMRWDNNLEESLPDGAYWPFNLGPRKCIGYQFAIIQSQLTLLEITRKMELSLIGDFPEGLAIATYRPKGKVMMKVSKIDQ
jgi:cytochrome P450